MSNDDEVNSGQLVRLADYRPPEWLARDTCLEFFLDEKATRVKSRIEFERNGDQAVLPALCMHGVDLKLIAAEIDGTELQSAQFRQTAEGIEIPGDRLPGNRFTWSCEVQICPVDNTALEGLYISNGVFCTQCEPEGFRKITYYPDRPDVMARFAVRIHGDLPVMLSNGNRIAAGVDWVEWKDPWPKPSYLFALVAGDLKSVDDHFVTASGRKVELKLWVRDGDQDKCGYALDALKRAMRWDEEEYGCEYDLDIFQIVAIDDFNMGAMENKSLNIFNSSCVLASPKTATDADYELIETIIAHEYFHNWSGNRVTCRDWFQLSLKEGFTVYRDEHFSSDQRSAAVTRIRHVQRLRRAQFREDAGPLAHAVRPEAYRAISNFYTATVYMKGSELVGMLHQLVGAKAYRKATDLYFERHDGQACTIEDWIKVFEDTTGRDLGTFARWYQQAGTPVISVYARFDVGELELRLKQATPPTPGQADKRSVTIPLALGLLDQSGAEVMATRTVELEDETTEFRFEDLAEEPVMSLGRGFSAPVIMQWETPEPDPAFLLKHDTDGFNKWQAGQSLLRRSLIDMATGAETVQPKVLEALTSAILDGNFEPAFRATLLDFPGEDELCRAIRDSGRVPDPDKVHAACHNFRLSLADHMAAPMQQLFSALEDGGSYSIEPSAAGRRDLRFALLRLIALLDDGDCAEKLFTVARSMTEEVGSLIPLLLIGKGERQAREFRERWEQEQLVIDKWLAMRIQCCKPSEAVALAKRMVDGPDYNSANPNRFRAVVHALARNHAGFHTATGSGYEFVANQIIDLDPRNPQMAAMTSAAFESHSVYDDKRKECMRAQLRRMIAAPRVSRDLGEMVERMLTTETASH